MQKQSWVSCPLVVFLRVRFHCLLVGRRRWPFRLGFNGIALRNTAHPGNDSCAAHPGNDNCAAHPGNDNCAAHPGNDNCAAFAGTNSLGAGLR